MNSFKSYQQIQNEKNPEPALYTITDKESNKSKFISYIKDKFNNNKQACIESMKVNNNFIDDFAPDFYLRNPFNKNDKEFYSALLLSSLPFTPLIIGIALYFFDYSNSAVILSSLNIGFALLALFSVLITYFCLASKFFTFIHKNNLQTIKSDNINYIMDDELLMFNFFKYEKADSETINFLKKLNPHLNIKDSSYTYEELAQKII